MNLGKLDLKDIVKYVEEHENEIEGVSERHSSFDTDRLNFQIINDFGPLSDRKNAPQFTLVNWDG